MATTKLCKSWEFEYENCNIYPYLTMSGWECLFSECVDSDWLGEVSQSEPLHWLDVPLANVMALYGSPIPTNQSQHIG